MKPHISIVIPVYNVSRYLRRCLDSVSNQTLQDIEIIIVNDCSPDPMDDAICVEFSEKDQRITYIKHDANKRQGGARNSALDIATGAYIWFIDSDDFIDINACLFLSKIAVKTEADIVAFSATSHVDDDLDLSAQQYYYYNRSRTVLDKPYTGADFISAAMHAESFHVAPWAHLFKRELLSTFRFRENVFHEDTDLIPIIIFNANSIYCLKYAPYFRLLRPTSTTQQPINDDSIKEKLLAAKSLLDYIASHNLIPGNSLNHYTHNCFQTTKFLLNTHRNPSESTLSLYQEVQLCYENIFKNTPPLPQKMNVSDLEQQIVHLQKELHNIKASRFWKFRTYLKKVSLFK